MLRSEGISRGLCYRGRVQARPSWGCSYIISQFVVNLYYKPTIVYEAMCGVCNMVQSGCMVYYNVILYLIALLSHQNGGGLPAYVYRLSLVSQ